ncbi:electron transport complex subunit RsxG [Buchnera aphidicola]|uniref:electron transport complex subunit RsxG n=1 Tax=Buchnera aphidicola TaxID=9 RepID=UPI003463CF3B
MKKINVMWKNSLLLSIFATIFIAMTVLFFHITKYKILQYEEEAKKIFLKEVVSKEIYSTCIKKLYKVQDILLGDNKIHNLWIFFKNKEAYIAVAESVAPDGYAGSINILVAADFNGTIMGVRVLSHQETPGIGDKIDFSVSNWISQFHNMHVFNILDNDILLKKYGGKIEQFTGATITPQAVTNAIKRTVLFIKNIVKTHYKGVK